MPQDDRPSPVTKRTSALGVLALSLVYHVIYLGSIFDIYFQSPVVSVPDRYRVEPELALARDEHAGEPRGGLAKRLVLIVGDGLRADKLFQQYPNPPFPGSDELPLPSSMEDLPHALVDNLHLDETAATRTTPAPFLRSLIQSGEAQWGISHTRVPTESRPGHVALIGGMYEDVSAVTRGWTTNPIPFDSVLNQSTHAYTFGSPDILPMFARGAKDEGKVETWSYDEEAEDFSRDATALDLWVLDQLERLFKNASTSRNVGETLKQEGNVFFLHLLGLDTTGHSYRPHGPEYHRNIRVVDHVVKRTVDLVSNFYGDDETAFVFTADHGMSSMGNHGDGHPDNTRTPLVVWGKGIRRRQDWEEPAMHDGYSIGWGLKGVRRDVEQADVAPLMSVLAGLPIPANSAGRVPLDYLDASPSFRARAAFANANQLLAEAEAKSELKRQHTLSFRPFPELVDDPVRGTLSPVSHRALVRRLIDEAKFIEAEKHSLDLLDVALRASAYFQKYDWLLLRSIVTLGYLGFMAYVSRYILANHVPTLSFDRSPIHRRPLSQEIVSKIPLAACLVTTTRFALERAPGTYSLYTFFASYFWHRVLSDPSPFVRLYRSVSKSVSPPSPRSPKSVAPQTSQAWLETAGSAVSTLVALELVAYGYSDRRAFSVVALAMGWAWPRFGGRAGRGRARSKSDERRIVTGWRGAMTVLAVFPLLPVEKGENLRIISAGAVVLLLIGAFAVHHIDSSPSPGSKRARNAVVAQMVLTVLSTIVTCSSATSLRLKRGLPVMNQYLGWGILVLSALVPILHGRPVGQPALARLSVLLVSFAPAFVILSLSYEALFYAAFVVCCVLWVEVEGIEAKRHASETVGVQDGTVEPVEDRTERDAREASEVRPASSWTEQRAITLDSVRVALFFLGFVHLGFFGVGNVASISSFYLEPVYRLMTVFAPFPMGALLLYKLLIPFVFLSAVSSLVNDRTRVPRLGLFLVASVLSEVLTIIFFFRVTDSGSWLEIGSSITNFVICSLLGLFLSTLLVLGEEVVRGVSFS
ncbi:hypothetical protein JCM10212_006095, partial [Sporobolomyces blumeae]